MYVCMCVYILFSIGIVLPDIGPRSMKFKDWILSVDIEIVELNYGKELT